MRGHGRFEMASAGHFFPAQERHQVGGRILRFLFDEVDDMAAFLAHPPLGRWQVEPPARTVRVHAELERLPGGQVDELLVQAVHAIGIPLHVQQHLGGVVDAQGIRHRGGVG